MTETISAGIALAHPDKLYIGGKWQAATSGRRFTLVNPATEEEFMAVAEAGPDDVESAVAAARQAFDYGPWPRMSASERAGYMRKFAEAIVKRGPAMDAAWTAQIGTPVCISRGSSAGSAWLLNYYADIAESYPFESIRPSMGMASKYATVVREPVGVVAAIAPWNGPLGTMLFKVAPALAAGCTVVMKPSPETPIEAFLMAEAAEEAGLPDGVINLLPADREAANMLVSHPGIDKVGFTGSTAAGLHIAQVCASRMARYTMELGGKSAAIVLDDFDPAAFGPIMAPLVTAMSGQVCINYSRILVPRKRHDDIVESLAASMNAIVVGDPLDENTYMGPLAMKRHHAKVTEYIEKGVAGGARVAAGGGRPAGLNRGYFVEPTVFANATNDMIIAQEEIFGPVTAVIPYDSEDEAAAIANASDFGLSGGVFTNDVDRAYAMGRRIRTGTFVHNGREFDVTAPFGGFKKSGVGRELGPEGMEAYVELKTIFTHEAPSHLR